ncbi:sugar phosphate nucleotidyltransferase [Alteromonadaceae bacterium BrNp21-10]|nr:sugar phosphate nucleotidyltransferase [Alteromonadaceae bacterium BrNp21-10]
MQAIILAGGLGSRLRPFTEVVPKPLLPLGEKSILEIQIEKLKESGCSDIYLAVNYKAEYIQSFLGDGTRYGINLHYSVEDSPLGTCGPLSLLKDKLHAPFLVMNGDILTKLKFSQLYEFANTVEDTPLTVATKIITTPFRFGDVKTENNRITSVQEKPEFNFEILAGIYAMTPDIFNYIPDNQYFGMDTLIQVLLKKQVPVGRYLIKDYWIDIGMMEDYERAKIEYSQT